MFERFDPTRRDEVFERRRGPAILLALGAYLSVGVYGVLQHQEKTAEVELEPEVKDLEFEEEPEIEEEEPPPPPPPEPEKPKPKPKPRSVTPNKLSDDALPESDTQQVEKEEVPEEAPPPEPPPEPEKPKPKVEETNKTKKPKPKVKKIDPTKPIKRPQGATEPKPNPANKPPKMPKALANEGIEGEVVIKLHIHRDGKVKGGKILRVKTTATGEDAQKKSKALMKKAVISAVRTWTFTPSKLKGQPISVWITVTIPFRLKAG